MGLNTGALYIIIILLIITGLAFLATGPIPTESPILTKEEVVIDQATNQAAQDRLQLLTFGGATITPPATSLCRAGGANARPEILIAYSPAHATAVSSDGFIKLWVSDANHLLIAPGEKVSNNSGTVLIPGDKTFKLPDGYIQAPALYVFPQTVEKNGQPYFPSSIRGDYNNGTVQVSRGRETLPYYAVTPNKYIVEYIWKVQDIGLTPDAYELQFVISDGSNTHGIGCIAIRVYDPVNKRYEIPD